MRPFRGRGQPLLHDLGWQRRSCTTRRILSAACRCDRRPPCRGTSTKGGYARVSTPAQRLDTPFEALTHCEPNFTCRSHALNRVLPLEEGATGMSDQPGIAVVVILACIGICLFAACRPIWFASTSGVGSSLVALHARLHAPGGLPGPTWISVPCVYATACARAGLEEL
jgi:hypothetical protein